MLGMATLRVWTLNSVHGLKKITNKIIYITISITTGIALLFAVLMLLNQKYWAGTQSCIKTHLILNQALKGQRSIGILFDEANGNLSVDISTGFIVICFCGSIICYCIIIIKNRMNRQTIVHVAGFNQPAFIKVELGTVGVIVTTACAFWMCFLPSVLVFQMANDKPGLWILIPFSVTLLHMFAGINPVILLAGSRRLRRIVRNAVRIRGPQHT